MLPRLSPQCPKPLSSPRVELPPAPRPILQLSVAQQILFVELIEPAILPEAAVTLWARPLLLVDAGSGICHDLRGSADLLWPAQQFQPAYAEDLLPHWAKLGPTLPEEVPQAKRCLQDFLQQVWQQGRAPA